tara:strand:+ start:1260 stop:1610 length:351 start_codon:yes stop_codon:yes gene_type:complete
MEKVFVYGTLKEGFSNHFILRETVKIGSGLTKKKYAMYSHGIPFLVENEKVSKITGELYMVDKTTFEVLDMLEGHPNWYIRKLVSVNIKNEEHKAWVYFNKKQGQLIKSGNYAKTY